MEYIGHNKAEVYKCKQCGSVREITPIGHAKSQWRKRSRLPHLDLIDVWNESIEIHRHRFDAEEVRYHHPTRMALLMQNTNIVTCIYIPTSRFAGKRACVQAMIKHNVDSKKIANLLNECAFTRETLEYIVEDMNRAETGTGSVDPAGTTETNTPPQNRS